MTWLRAVAVIDWATPVTGCLTILAVAVAYVAVMLVVPWAIWKVWVTLSSVESVRFKRSLRRMWRATRQALRDADRIARGKEPKHLLDPREKRRRHYRAMAEEGIREAAVWAWWNHGAGKP